MIKSLSWILAGSIAVSGCSGPIQTRVQTHQVIASPAEKQFTISSLHAVANQDLALARDVVAKSLSAKGYQLTPNASILVHVGLSDRLANFSINAGDKTAEETIAIAKKAKPLQSCQDREHRLTVNLFDQARGSKLYSGNASEYHCKGTIQKSLPFLAKSALSGLDTDVSEAPRSATHSRLGTD
ncbi:hypothetical protein [Parasphingorhabdus sp.]|uniref:hypothetical protein n=1 Tax=Parasphingorhabdus sp. TaxID=2709688 RepID=UPI00326455F4